MEQDKTKRRENSGRTPDKTTADRMWQSEMGQKDRTRRG